MIPIMNCRLFDLAHVREIRIACFDYESLKLINNGKKYNNELIVVIRGFSEHHKNVIRNVIISCSIPILL